MNNIKYIFRDFRWTVVDIDVKKNGHFSHISKIYDTTKDEIRKSLGDPRSKLRRWEINERELWEQFSQNIWKPIHQDCLTMFHKKDDMLWRPNKSIVKFKDKLQTLWFKNIILSDEVEPQGENIRNRWRYDGFEDVILSYNIWMSKYDDIKNNTSRAYDYALKKYNIQAEEAVFVDDIEDNCIRAADLWIQTIVAKNSTQVIRDLKKLLNI